jgi:hypothetical protein
MAYYGIPEDAWFFILIMVAIILALLWNDTAGSSSSSSSSSSSRSRGRDRNRDTGSDSNDTGTPSRTEPNPEPDPEPTPDTDTQQPWIESGYEKDSSSMSVRIEAEAGPEGAVAGVAIRLQGSSGHQSQEDSQGTTCVLEQSSLGKGIYSYEAVAVDSNGNTLARDDGQFPLGVSQGDQLIGGGDNGPMVIDSSTNINPALSSDLDIPDRLAERIMEELVERIEEVDGGRGLDQLERILTVLMDPDSDLSDLEISDGGLERIRDLIQEIGELALTEGELSQDDIDRILMPIIEEGEFDEDALIQILLNLRQALNENSGGPDSGDDDEGNKNDDDEDGDMPDDTEGSFRKMYNKTQKDEQLLQKAMRDLEEYHEDLEEEKEVAETLLNEASTILEEVHNLENEEENVLVKLEDNNTHDISDAEKAEIKSDLNDVARDLAQFRTVLRQEVRAEHNDQQLLEHLVKVDNGIVKEIEYLADIAGFDASDLLDDVEPIDV